MTRIGTLAFMGLLSTLAIAALLGFAAAPAVAQQPAPIRDVFNGANSTLTSAMTSSPPRAPSPLAAQLFKDSGVGHDRFGDPYLILHGRDGSTTMLRLAIIGGQVAVELPVQYAVNHSGLQLILGESNQYTNGNIYILKDKLVYSSIGGDEYYGPNDPSRGLIASRPDTSRFEKIDGVYVSSAAGLTVHFAGKTRFFSLLPFPDSNGLYVPQKSGDPNITDLNVMFDNYDGFLEAIEDKLGLQDPVMELSEHSHFHPLSEDQVIADVRSRNPSFFDKHSGNSGSHLSLGNILLGGLISGELANVPGASSAQLLSAVASGAAGTATAEAQGQDHTMAVVQGVASSVGVSTSDAQNGNLIQQTANEQTAKMLAIGNAAAEQQQALRTQQQALAVQQASAAPGWKGATNAGLTNPRGPFTVTVQFTHSRNSLQGSAHVVSTPPGIDCPTQCSASFDRSTDVRLVATADANSFVEPIACSWQSTGTGLKKPGNSEPCVILSRFNTGTGPDVVMVNVDLWGSNQQQALGNGMPPVPAPAKSSFPNSGGNSAAKRTCVPPPGAASCVDMSPGGDGSDFVSGNGVPGVAAGGGTQGNGSGSGTTGIGTGGGSGGVPGFSICNSGGRDVCVPPINPACVSYFYDKNMYGWFAFQNNCSVAVDIVFAGFNGKGGGEIDFLGVGRHESTGEGPSEVASFGGGYAYYVCPAHYSAITANGLPANRPNEQVTCHPE